MNAAAGNNRGMPPSESVALGGSGGGAEHIADSLITRARRGGSLQGQGGGGFGSDASASTFIGSGGTEDRRRGAAGVVNEPLTTSSPKMSDPTRDEIDAKLATVRADGRAEAAALRGEFADIRGGMTTEFVAVRGEMKAGFEALRSEMHKNSSDIIKWVIGTAVGLGVAGITVMAFVLNNAVPKAPVATVQPPIVINVPTSAPPAPAPSLPKP